MANVQLMMVVILWGASFVLAKIVLEYLTPVETLAARLILAVIVLKIIISAKRIRLKINRDDVAVLLFASIILSLHFFIQITGLNYTSATNTGWLIAVAPVFIAIASYLFLKEKLRSLQIVGILIATVGVILLVSKGHPGRLDWLKSSGDWLILVSGITWTIYTIATRNITRRINPVNMIFVLLLIPTFGFCIYVLFTMDLHKFLTMPPKVLAAILAYGILSMGVAHWLWLEGLSKKGAAKAGAFIYLEPIVTTITAIILINEKLTALSYFGGLLIIGGVYLVQSKMKSAQQ